MTKAIRMAAWATLDVRKKFQNDRAGTSIRDVPEYLTQMGINPTGLGAQRRQRADLAHHGHHLVVVRSARQSHITQRVRRVRGAGGLGWIELVDAADHKGLP